MPKGEKSGKLMMATWFGKPPRIVEVLGLMENGSYWVREANTDAVTGCRDENLHEYDARDFARRRHEAMLVELDRKKDFHQGVLVALEQTEGDPQDERITNALDMLDKAQSVARDNDTRFAEETDDGDAE